MEFNITPYAVFWIILGLAYIGLWDIIFWPLEECLFKLSKEKNFEVYFWVEY